MAEKLFESDDLVVEFEERTHLGEDKRYFAVFISKDDDSDDFEFCLDLDFDGLILIGADQVNSTSPDSLKAIYNLDSEERSFEFLVEEKGLKPGITFKGETENEEFSEEVEI